MDLICTRPSDLTRESLKSLRLALGREGFTARQLNAAMAQMSNKDIAADIIGLIRCYGINARLLGHEERIRRAVSRLKQAHSFSRTEEKWIDRMEKYLLNESVLSVRTFDESVAFRDKGGFAALDKLFHNRLADLVAELNRYLYDDGGLAA
jgi:type I restriction enzyme R subunit